MTTTVLRYFAAAALAGGLWASIAPAAFAHVQDANGQWLFTGSTYGTTSATEENRSDPLTLIFRGPPGAATSTNEVQSHIETDWSARAVPAGYPDVGEMKRRGVVKRACREKQWVFMRDAAGDGRFDDPRMYMTTNGLCTTQYHMRFWSDRHHQGFFSQPNDWMLASIHHEHPVIRSICSRSATGPICAFKPDHQVDFDWDLARVVGYKAMAQHCSYRQWAVHPGAKHMYSRRHNSGIISRISMRHVSSGCAGA